VVSGERGAGKSTVCRETVALARARGYTCGGLLTLSRPDDTLDVLDVRSGDVRRLTVGPSTGSGQAPDASPAPNWWHGPNSNSICPRYLLNILG